MYEYVFLILSLLVFSTIALRNFVSTACSLLYSLLVSAVYNSIFFKYTLNIVSLHSLYIFIL
jgi:hypothetical protein